MPSPAPTNLAMETHIMKRTSTATAILMALMVITAAGCKDFTEGKSVAKVNDAAPGETTGQETVGTPAEGTPEVPGEETPAKEEPTEARRVYKATENTAVAFEGSKTIDTHVGGFNTVEGTITMVGDDPETAEVKITIDMTSIYSDNSLLTSVLSGESFFNIENYKTSTFTSTAIKKTDEGIEMTGTLDLNGVTRSITFPATVNITDDKVTSEAEFVVMRSWWSVGYDDWKGELIKDKVVLMLEVEATLDEQASASEPAPAEEEAPAEEAAPAA